MTLAQLPVGKEGVITAVDIGREYPYSVDFSSFTTFAGYELKHSEPLIKNNAIGICLSCPAPLFYNRKCIVVIHDMATCAHPEFYSKKYFYSMPSPSR